MVLLRPSEQQRKFFVALVFLGLCFLAYGNSLRNNFLMDDLPTLLENRQINTSSFWQIDLQGHLGQDYFRPAMHFLNFVTYNLFKKDPFGYHLFNLFLFYLACLSLHELLSLHMKDRTIPFLACVLFCVHPINGILVNYKNATGYSLLILAMNVSLICFLQAPHKQNKVIRYAVGLAWLTVALLCHELVLAFPLYQAAALWFWGNERLKTVVCRSAVPLIVLAPYVFFRAYYFSFKSTIFDKIPQFDVSLVGAVAAYIKLIGWYLLKLVSLDGIVLMWSVPPVEAATSALPFVALGGIILGYIVWRLLKSPRPNNTSFALSWMIIGFLPVALGCFSRPLFGILIEPHWLFFSSIGYFVLIAVLLRKLRNVVPGKLWHLFLAGVFLFHLSPTYRYNHLWGDQKRYCHYWRGLAPFAYWPNFWLGYSYLEEKNYRAAQEAYGRVADLGIRDPSLYTNLGIAEYFLGNRDKALKYFKRALEMDPRNADTLCSLGDIFLLEHDIPKAQKAYTMALDLDPTLRSYIQKSIARHQQQSPARMTVP